MERIAQYTQATNTSLLTLAERSGVKYDTLLGIANPNKRQKPTEGTAGRLIRIIEDPHRRTPVLTRYFPYLKEYLQNNPDTAFTMDASAGPTAHEVYLTSAEVDNLMTDPVSYQIFTLAGFDKGISLAEVRRHFGLLGVAKLKKLLKKRILQVHFIMAEHGPTAVVRTHHKYYRTLTVDNLLVKIRHGLDIYSERPPSEDCRYVGVYASEFDSRDRLEIREALKAFSALIAKINKRKKTGPTKGMYINFFAGDFLPKAEVTEHDKGPNGPL